MPAPSTPTRVRLRPLAFAVLAVAALGVGCGDRPEQGAATAGGADQAPTAVQRLDDEEGATLAGDRVLADRVDGPRLRFGDPQPSRCSTFVGWATT